MKARLTLKVRAGARRTEFAGPYDSGWKLNVAAPPVDGKANQAITRFLAKLAGIPASSVRIVTGATNSTISTTGQCCLSRSPGPKPEPRAENHPAPLPKNGNAGGLPGEIAW